MHFICFNFNNEINLRCVNEAAEFGGLLGPGNSNNCFKVFRLHAIFHDAFGFLKSNFNVGPGFVYAISRKPIFANAMFLGHILG